MPTSNKKLLERAAKAAGFTYDPQVKVSSQALWGCYPDAPGGQEAYQWDPLSNPAQGVDLENRLRITVEWGVKVVSARGPFRDYYTELIDGNPAKARMLVTVRMAASMAPGADPDDEPSITMVPDEQILTLLGLASDRLKEYASLDYIPNGLDKDSIAEDIDAALSALKAR